MSRGRRLGPEAPFVFSLSGLIFSLPACLLPFISAGKLGDKRVSLLFTGVEGLWYDGMRALSLLVLFCGDLIPIGLLACLVFLLAPNRHIRLSPALVQLARLARFLERWSMPEVQVLAVLVALLKLGSLVDVTIQTGFWCYCAMTFSLIMALRSFELESLPGGALRSEPVPAQ